MITLHSTAGKINNTSLKDAIFKSLPQDNGLYMLDNINMLPEDFINQLPDLSFEEICFKVTQNLLGKEIEEGTLKNIVSRAIDFPAPLKSLTEDIHVLELFHGPSLAFKDFGARFMAHLMSYFLSQSENKETIDILVATSGDTGSAVAQGFYGMDNVRVSVLYPSQKVSYLQEKQLTTLGGNITALEIEGTFDDCQRLVKTAFLNEKLNERFHLSSANSINIARLIPQSFYYFEAYAQLKRKNKNLHDITFAIPSGNFGNLCGGLLAMKMGLPVNKIIATTNSNDIVPQYLKTGEFNPKDSVKTLANAMDVGNPSNFPRLKEFFANDYEQIKNKIIGFSYTDDEIKKTILDVYEKYNYLMCPHTSIGYMGAKDYCQKKQGNDSISSQTVFLSTAHPIKFYDIIEPIIEKKIDIPERLKETIDKEKQSFKLSSRFEEFRDYLMER